MYAYISKRKRALLEARMRGIPAIGEEPSSETKESDSENKENVSPSPTSHDSINQ